MREHIGKSERAIGEQYSPVLGNVIHIIAGIGVGLLVYSALTRRGALFGYLLVGLSLLIHAYDAMTPERRA